VVEHGVLGGGVLRGAEHFVANGDTGDAVTGLVDDARRLEARNVWGRGTGMVLSVEPLRIFQSTGFTAAARTATRTWPAPAWGSGISARCSRPGLPTQSN
jgi:hypothetical protein